MKKVVILFVAILMLSVSCVVMKTNETFAVDENGLILERGKNILVATPADGEYDGQVYTGTGKGVAESLREELNDYASSVKISKAESFEKFSASEINSFDYFFVPTIIHWEDGIKSQYSIDVKVTYDIYDKNKQLLNSFDIEINSSGSSQNDAAPIDFIYKVLENNLYQVFK